MGISRGCLLVVVWAGCGGGGIDSNEEARRAYFALAASISRSIQLGFDGFNAANSANIDPQSAPGSADGTLTITGQVDQGSSANKGMRLRVGMVGYTDGDVPVGDDTVFVVFDTADVPTEQPALDIQLKGIPTGTLDGTLTGVYLMSGDLEGEAELELGFAGTLQDDGAGGVERVPGSTTVTGVVRTPDNGSFTVDVTL